MGFSLGCDADVAPGECREAAVGRAVPPRRVVAPAVLAAGVDDRFAAAGRA